MQSDRLKKFQGFTLIEILVSLFILSLFLLGLDAMQITALREARAAYFFSVASQQLNVMAERLAVLPDQSNLEEEIARWNKQNQAVLPLGRGQPIGHDSHSVLQITWGKRDITECKHNHINQSGCLRRAINSMV